MSNSEKPVLEFFFDYSSPYSYLAAMRIDAMANSYGVSVHWKPFLLGAMFKTTGASALTDQHEWKTSYFSNDFARSAEFAEVEFVLPSKFPQASLAACRTTQWIEKTLGARAAVEFAQKLFSELFTKDADISNLETLANLASAVGANGAELAAAVQDPGVKQLLNDRSAEAHEKKVFGAPMFILDGERFWGFDRFNQLEARIKQKVGGKSYKTMIEQASAQIQTITAGEARVLYQEPDVVFVDLRDPRELEREGVVPNALHAPRGMVEFWVDPKSPYYKPAFDPSKRFVFFCAAGWRSALATATVKDMGVLPHIAHIEGGFAAWKHAGGAVESKPSK
jgi:2-hydroxychromene-2-carboxylate isomerase/rhodanese-related sulfurtransferase